MYEKKEFTADLEFYQGDIVDDFPLFIFTQQFNLLSRTDTANSFKINKVSSIPTNKKEFLGVFPIRLSRVIILSQTCDIQNNNTVIVAPVYSLTEVTEDGRLSEGNVNLISKRRGAMKDWFYLPKLENIIEESFVDFQIIHYLPSKVLDDYLEKRVVALSDWGRHLLSWALADYFGRPIEDRNKTNINI